MVEGYIEDVCCELYLYVDDFYAYTLAQIIGYVFGLLLCETFLKFNFSSRYVIPICPCWIIYRYYWTAHQTCMIINIFFIYLYRLGPLVLAC